MANESGRLRQMGGEWMREKAKRKMYGERARLKRRQS